LSDRFGRRSVLLWGLALFTLASLGCVLAPTVEVFLAFRMAQAVVVVGLVLSRAVVRDIVPQNEAASMIGYVTMGMALVPMIGPAIGGVLEDTLGWHSNFWLLALLGIAIFALVYFDLGETNLRPSASFAAQIRDYPELLTSRRFWGYCLASAFASGAFFAYLGGAPFVGDEIFGLSPTWLGIYFGAPAVGYMVGNFISGRYSVRMGINAMVLWGSVLNTIGLLIALSLFLTGYRSAEIYFSFMTFVGLGNGMVIPNATAGMLSVRPQLAGTASGLGAAVMIGGGAALSALAGALLTVESGTLPLLWTQLATAAAALAAILYVIRRERHLTTP
jgi:DHA1 family bicyclomycin/chloramphenicol resistance-like MFS transporter